MFHCHQVVLGTALSAVAILLVSTPPGRATANLSYCTVEEVNVECFYATEYQCEAAARNTGRTCILNPTLNSDQGYSSAFASADMPLQATPVAQTGRVQMASVSTADIRRECIAEAHARHPDRGLGSTTVMPQRTLTYADCARRNGIRP
jgi:hypothetical protein